MPGLGPGIHQFSRKVLRRRWITGSSPVTTISRRVPILIRRNLDQAAVGIAWPHIDLLMAEHQRRPWRFARARIEHPDLHAEDFLVPLRGMGHVGDVDDDMIERVDLDSHALSFRRGSGAGTLLAAS